MKEIVFFSRNDPRISLEVRVSVEKKGKQEGTKALRAKSIDLSKEGISLSSPEKFPQKTQLELTFRLPGTAGSVQVLGQVVRQKKDSDGENYITGIKITEMDENSREKLNEFFDSEIYYGWFY